MNVRLARTWRWQSGLVYDDAYHINRYTAKVYMYTNTDRPHDHEIAYGRIDYWFQEVLQDCVMLEDHSAMVAAYSHVPQRSLLLPGPPVDQLVGIMLYLKLNAMCEQRMIITDVELHSEHGDHMAYLHNETEGTEPFTETGWWHDSRPVWSYAVPKRSSKVVALTRVPEWHALDLEWHPVGAKSDSSVLFADFNRDDNK